MAKYLLQHALFQGEEMKKALRIAFNLNPAYPIRQGEVVFKCKGLKDANEIIDKENIPISKFARNYYSYTSNSRNIELCDAEGSGIIFSYTNCPSRHTDFIGWDKLSEILKSLQ